MDPPCGAAQHQPRRLSLGQTLARRNGDAACGAARGRGARRQVVARSDYRSRAGELLRQDPIRRPLSLAPRDREEAVVPRELAPMIETHRIETAPGLVFDVSVAGADGAPLVLLLHGFCVSCHFWDNQLPALAQAGYFAVAPNQRGYSVDARPDPQDFDQYRVDRLTGDALDIVAAAGHG